MSELQDRSAYTAGLRALADLIDVHPQVPAAADAFAPFLFVFGDAAPVVEAFTAAAGRPVAADLDDEGTRLTLSWRLAALPVRVNLPAEEVCTRRGMRQVTEWALPAHLDPAPVRQEGEVKS
ncbi:hypothetical protein OHR68_03765 [Spirillospora sp. NBC_00431]